MRFVLVVAISGIALALAGCQETKPVQSGYLVPLDQALARLKSADVIGFRNARQCGLLIHITPLLPVGNSVTFTVQSRNRLMTQFTVSLTATPAGTTEAVIRVPGVAGGGEDYDGKQHYAHPALMQPLRPAVKELIDAAMEKRPYDWQKIPDDHLNEGPGETMTNCGMGQQTLARGIPMSLDDPEGIPHDTAVELGLVH